MFLDAFRTPSEIAAGEDTSTLERAVRGMINVPRVRINPDNPRSRSSVALGWHIISSPALGGDVYWHNGQTGGSKSYVAFMPSTGAAVVVLANYPDQMVDRMAQNLLLYAVTGEIRPAPVREFVSLTAAQAEPLTGVYQFPDGRKLTITNEGASVFAQLEGQQRFRIYPERQRLFFYKVVPAEIAFVFDAATNRAGELIFRQNRGQVTAPRIGDVPTGDANGEEDGNGDEGEGGDS
jgi:hypothetical protein